MINLILTHIEPSAIGVIYTDSNEKSHRVFVRRNGEVILSAGAIGSPQLLLLSGVGPYSYLSSLHIPIVQSQSNVGKFMFDNPRNAVTLKSPFPVEISPVQTVGITNNYYIQGVSSLENSSSLANWSVGTIAEKVPGPLSRGSLRLNSSIGVRVSPCVRFNYFANPVDLSKYVSGMRKIGEMLNTKTMDQFKFEDSNGARSGSLLSKHSGDDTSLSRRVGKVVNGNFRVKGIDSLRVVDGSTFTTTPGTNPQATVMMLGRCCGKEEKGSRALRCTSMSLQVSIEHIWTNSMIADPLTRGLLPKAFHKHTAHVGVVLFNDVRV
ncbi:(R)-mandelonitrile lyase 1 [Morus notabilis]|uniref:(R)-mandelonitrile lyase n=1 Tax=Morus notabilis TaxID=981085 RepID=W9RVV4_9ROSA|nr:(R)-mandelonitrile lyase 1 [Morus notabilis]